MRRRIIAMILVVMAIFSLAGCSSKYPKIKIYNSEFSENNTEISVGDRYKLKDYDKSYTDDGCEVTIYFENATKEE